MVANGQPVRWAMEVKDGIGVAGWISISAMPLILQDCRRAAVALDKHWPIRAWSKSGSIARGMKAFSPANCPHNWRWGLKRRALKIVHIGLHPSDVLTWASLSNAIRVSLAHGAAFAAGKPSRTWPTVTC